MHPAEMLNFSHYFRTIKSLKVVSVQAINFCDKNIFFLSNQNFSRTKTLLISVINLWCWFLGRFSSLASFGEVIYGSVFYESEKHEQIAHEHEPVHGRGVWHFGNLLSGTNGECCHCQHCCYTWFNNNFLYLCEKNTLGSKQFRISCEKILPTWLKKSSTVSNEKSFGENLDQNASLLLDLSL